MNIELILSVVSMINGIANSPRAMEMLKSISTMTAEAPAEAPKAPAKAAKKASKAPAKTAKAPAKEAKVSAKAIRNDGRPSRKAMGNDTYMEKDGQLYRRFGGRVYRTVIDPAETVKGSVESCYGLIYRQVDGTLNLVAKNPTKALIAKLVKDANNDSRKGVLYADCRGMNPRPAKFVQLSK